MRTIVLDNEAVQALAATTHPKHRNVLAHLEGVASRRRRGRVVEAVVPTSVRVEAGWDRTDPAATLLNRFGIRDHQLDGHAANTAASLVSTGVVSSVADAHLGATVRGTSVEEIVVISSDPHDMAAVCAPTPVRIVPI
ncbi:MAG: hypothetical protein U5K29_06680 [Acidimicrobiales bacterium]|nr:hypothetical protein [Acidimicrobiales bacterium]